MWTCVPRGWWGREYGIAERGAPVATLSFGAWNGGGAILADGERLTLERRGFWNPKYDLLRRHERVAVAERAGAFRGGFYVAGGDLELRLEPASFLSRTCRVWQKSHVAGEIRPRGWFGRTLEIELEEELPFELRLFVVWLFVLRQRQAAAAAAAS